MGKEKEELYSEGLENVSKMIFWETSAILLAMNLYMKRMFGEKYFDEWDYINETVQEYRENFYKEIADSGKKKELQEV